MCIQALASEGYTKCTVCDSAQCTCVACVQTPGFFSESAEICELVLVSVLTVEGVVTLEELPLEDDSFTTPGIF